MPRVHISMYRDRRVTDKRNAGKKDAASRLRWLLAKSVDGTFESESGMAEGGKGNASPTTNRETPMAPIAPVSTVCGKYATWTTMSELYDAKLEGPIQDSLTSILREQRKLRQLGMRSMHIPP